MKFSRLLAALGLPVAALAKGDCATNSAALKNMTLRSYSVYHSPSAHAHLKGDFDIFNPGPDQDYPIKAMPYADDSRWHECEPVPKGLLGCQYIYDSDYNIEIGFVMRWSCTDKDAQHPTVFNATIKASLYDLVPGVQIPLVVSNLTQSTSTAS